MTKVLARRSRETVSATGKDAIFVLADAERIDRGEFAELLS